MKYVLNVIIVAALFMGGCTKDNFIKSGLSDGRFDGSLLEYMEAPGHSYDWDSTALMVRRAGEDMVRLFEGKDPAHPEITFFGPTNHSIRRYMLQNKILRVADMEPEWCKEILLRHVFDGKIYRDDVPRGKGGDRGDLGEGGERYTSLGNVVLWLFTFRETYGNVQEAGAVKLKCMNVKWLNMIEIATTNIEPDNCVVHSLGYSYTLGEL